MKREHMCQAFPVTKNPWLPFISLPMVHWAKAQVLKSVTVALSPDPAIY